MVDGRDRGVVSGLVARDAGRDRDLIVVIDVAESASSRDVRAGQRETRLRMVEGGWLPRRRIMANVAGLRETSSHVVGILSALEVRQVAGNAGRDRDVVVVIEVAAGAGRGDVKARERPASGRVVELSVGPENGIVALFAGGREAHVIDRRGSSVKR